MAGLIATKVTPVPRLPRADARRNRERILAAARLAFSEYGIDVHMELVARQAGVGIGTLYRHFPTKQALVTEIVRNCVSEAVAVARHALTLDDPALALRTLLHNAARAMARDVGLRETFGDLPIDELCPMEDTEFEGLVATILRQAKAAGALRTDVRLADFRALVCGMALAIAKGAHWRRCAEILVAGLRPA